MSVSLVTGGAGFIGSNLCEALLKGGERVRVLDDLSTGRRENADRLLSAFPGAFEFVEGDVCDEGDVSKALADVERVFHLAAVPSVQRSVESPVDSLRVNFWGSVTLLDAARRLGVSRVVAASSSSVYGDSDELPKHEGMPPKALSPYAASKASMEQACAAFSHCYGLRTAVLRFFNVYGPRQDPASEYAAVIPKFFAAALAGEPAAIYGDGRQTRDFTYVGFVVDAMVRAAGAEGGFFVLNVASGVECSVLSLWDAVSRLCGAPDAKRFEPERPGEIRRSVGSIDLLKRTLDLGAPPSLEEGLRASLPWFRDSLGNRG